jgi:flagellar M-ring protein FliF
METGDLGDRPATARRLYVLGTAVVLVLLLVAGGYLLFLRPNYVVLAQGLRPADASAVVGELDKRGVAYRLRDGGSTILVPEAQADATRIAIAGTDAAARGQTGFELFNKSDMGLTNFAQKINYQRALQGELVRTITAMEGVESARVHLALPERSLFRSERVEPKAAVTLTMKLGQVADPARVSGIQQLVAAAVPDLPPAKVVVLDAEGRAISAAPVIAADGGSGDRPADLEERVAVENYYRARARGAIERQMPGIRFVLRVLVLPTAAAREANAPATTPLADWAPSGEGAARDFRLRVLFMTEAPLTAEDQQVARGAIVQATGLSEATGDDLSFATGPIDQPAAAPPVARPSDPVRAPTTPAEPIGDVSTGFAWPPIWLWLVASIAFAAVLVWRFRGASTRLKTEEHQAFAQRLSRQLNLAEESRDAAA